MRPAGFRRPAGLPPGRFLAGHNRAAADQRPPGRFLAAAACSVPGRLAAASAAAATAAVAATAHSSATAHAAAILQNVCR